MDEEEEEEKKPAIKGGEVDCNNMAKAALLASQQPLRPLSYNYHSRVGEAAAECANLPKQEQEEVEEEQASLLRTRLWC